MKLQNIKIALQNAKKSVFLKSTIIFISFLSLNSTYGQDSLRISDFFQDTYGLSADSLNFISNDELLFPFFEKLKALKQSKSSTVKIVHIGDSHLQADMLTSVLRNKFQQHFGNAGRGLVFPYQVANTNGCADYSFSSSSNWEVKRGAFPAQPLPIGICGITVRNTNEGTDLTLKTKNTAGVDNSFDKITLFHEKGENAFDWMLKDESFAGNNTIASSAALYENDFCNTFYLSKPTQSVRLNTIANTEKQRQSTIFGLSLENSHSGILYHTIGFNGAQMSHYNAAAYFFKQLQLLEADLLIVSLGTNEAQVKNLDPEVYRRNLDLFFENIRNVYPNTPIIITTPADSYLKNKSYNKSLQTMAEGLVSFSKMKNMSCWDLYNLTGGYGSCAQWRKSGLMRPDGVHYDSKGYNLQANLFFKALTDSYHEFLSKP